MITNLTYRQVTIKLKPTNSHTFCESAVIELVVWFAFCFYVIEHHKFVGQISVLLPHTDSQECTKDCQMMHKSILIEIIAFAHRLIECNVESKKKKNLNSFEWICIQKWKKNDKLVDILILTVLCWENTQKHREKWMLQIFQAFCCVYFRTVFFLKAQKRL